jgi:type IV fimbrial biogenesis protein FimT
MLKSPSAQSGVTLIEIVIALAIVSTLLVLGTASFGEWIQNAQIRGEAESFQAGLQLARAAAVQRNAPVRFSLTTSTDNSCAVSTGGTNWVASLADPAGACGAASDVVPPGIVQVGASEGSLNAAVASNLAAIAFLGTGQPQGNAALTIDVSNPVGGACVEDGGAMRCLRVTVSASGQIRMCDPALADLSEPGACQ